MKRLFPLIAFIFISACGREESVSGVQSNKTLESSQLNKTSTVNEENTPKTTPPDPFLREVPENSPPWIYMAGADYGLRSDDLGDGAFYADRRGTPSHKGVDFLMPVGTKLMSPCTGEYLSGYEGSFGNWVQIVCKVPTEVQGTNETFIVSMLYAHLKERIPSNSVTWKTVQRGEWIGYSGKTGNANDSRIRPHLHYETIIHTSMTAAKNEMHGGAGSAPAHLPRFVQKLNSYCLNPFEFKSLEAPFTFGNRIDPFVLLSCLSTQKPELKKPSSQTWIKWSYLYKVTGYNVDIGR